jgi:hypothetical protein
MLKPPRQYHARYWECSSYCVVSDPNFFRKAKFYALWLRDCSNRRINCRLLPLSEFALDRALLNFRSDVMFERDVDCSASSSPAANLAARERCFSRYMEESWDAMFSFRKKGSISNLYSFSVMAVIWLWVSLLQELVTDDFVRFHLGDLRTLSKGNIFGWGSLANFG